MNYFSKINKDEFNNMLPLILLPTITQNLNLIYGDLRGLYLKKTNEEKFISYELPISVYLACWRLANLLILDIIEEKLNYERNEINSSNNLSHDLGADSLDVVEIATYLEKTASINISEKVNFKNISDLTDYIFTIIILRIQKEIKIWSNINVKLF